jgi:hypothetical protein
VLLRDVIDELLNDDSLADAGAAEEADLSAACVRAKEIDDLDTGLERLHFGRLLDELGRLAVDRQRRLRADRAHAVHRLADHVQDPAQRRLADRHANAVAGVASEHAAHEAVGRVHTDATHGTLSEVLSDLEDQVVLAFVDRRVGDGERIQNRGQLAGVEFDVDHGSDDLGDFPDVARTIRCHDEPPDQPARSRAFNL